MKPITLKEAINRIAEGGGLNPDVMLAYALEDNIGGRDTGDWPGMSTYADEGRILYALVRTMRPEICIEIGVDSGGTSTHILTALYKNGSGILYSYDIKDVVGTQVPDYLRDRWILTAGIDALEVDLPPYSDFVFEDGPHDFEWTRDMLLRLKETDPSIILSHDMYAHEHYGDSFQVEKAFKEALGVDTGVITHGSTTGLGYWWNKGTI